MDISILEFSSKSMIKNLQLILDLKEGEIMNFLFNWQGRGGGGAGSVCFYTRVKHNKKRRVGGRERELVCLLLRVT